MQPYVALGDSYSAGVGGGDRRGLCFRGRNGYPPLLAQALQQGLDYQACSGAIIDSMRRTQFGALTNQTQTVTLTIGGNNAGFATVVSRAASPSWLADGMAAIRGAQQIIRTQLTRTLPEVYAEIRTKAPHARIVVATYPRLFSTVDCQPLTFFTAAELTALNATADLIAEVIQAAAEQAGIECLDVRAQFDGHDVCATMAYVNGLMLPVDESFHPSPQGHQAYADILAAHLGARRSAITTEVRLEEGADQRGPAPKLSLPRLDSPDALAKAAAAGLDPDTVAQLGRRLARWWDGGRRVREGVRPLDPEPTPAEVEAAEELRALGEDRRIRHPDG